MPGPCFCPSPAHTVLTLSDTRTHTENTQKVNQSKGWFGTSQRITSVCTSWTKCLLISLFLPHFLTHLNDKPSKFISYAASALRHMNQKTNGFRWGPSSKSDSFFNQLIFCVVLTPGDFWQFLLYWLRSLDIWDFYLYSCCIIVCSNDDRSLSNIHVCGCSIHLLWDG